MTFCYRHVRDVGRSSCRKCRQTICHSCAVDVPRLGTLCKTCALTAAGIRMRPRHQAFASP